MTPHSSVKPRQGINEGAPETGRLSVRPEMRHEAGGLPGTSFDGLRRDIRGSSLSVSNHARHHVIRQRQSKQAGGY